MSKTSWDLIRPSFSVLLNEQREGKIIAVEVGVEEGKNAVVMLQQCPKLFLYLVDTTDSPVLQQRIVPFNDRVEFVNKSSVDASKMFPDRHFDYIYIDALHELTDVTSDLTHWYPKIKEGGVISGHDWWYEGVRQAVCQFFTGKGQLLYAVHNMCIGTVPSVDAEMMDWWVKKR